MSAGSRKKSAASRKKKAARKTRQARASSRARKTLPEPSHERTLLERLGDAAGRLLGETASLPLRMGGGLVLLPRSSELTRAAGAYLRDLRHVAGLTRDELAQALDLEDRSLLDAVENGSAVLSFELILRLSSLVARHDPVPFISRMTRTYNPAVWKLLEDWGIGRLPLQYERERQFINVYRRHDAARKLSDEGFEKVLGLTRAAFEMALHFVAENEGVDDRPRAASRPRGSRRER